MSHNNHQQSIEERVKSLTEHLATVRRNTEKLIADNQRLREVVRLAEAELRKRRDQVQKLETELNTSQHQRQEAKDRVEHAIEKLEQVMARPSEEQA